MTVFNRQIASATRLIKKYGQSVIWRKLPRTVTTPGHATAGANQDNTVKIVFLKQGSSLADALLTLFRNTEVTTGAPYGLMAAVPFVPELTDVVIRNGVTLAISSINILEPDGTPILYSVEFK